MAGVLAGIRIRRVDLVAHLGGQREYVRITHRCVGERVEPHAALQECGCDAVRRAELGGIAVRRPLFVGERLPQPVYRALRHFAHHLRDLFSTDAVRGKTTRAIDVGVSHRAAWIGLERERAGAPALAETIEERGVVTHRRMGKPMEQAMGPLEYRAGPDKPRTPEECSAQA